MKNDIKHKKSMKNISFNLFLLPVALLMLFTAYGNLKAGDNGKYMGYALKVNEFDTAGSRITVLSDGEVNIINSGGSILRFRVNKDDELRTYHCGIVFIHYIFNNGWINKYKTFDINGSLKGDDEFEDLAIVEYEIRKMNLLHAKFEVLNEADGNIEMKDAKDEIVYMKAYDSKNRLIKENYISTKEYWMANNVLYRP